MTAIYTDVGAFVGADCAVLAEGPTEFISGAPNDATQVDGPDIDRDVWSDRGMSASFLIPFNAIMATTETCTIETQIQDSADGITYLDFDGPVAGSGTLTVVYGGATGAQDIIACHKHDINIRMARRYLRVQTTITLSRGATDTCAYGGVCLVGGQQELPGTGEEEALP